MSRSLPSRAHLEHLKKQAKDLLRLASGGDPASVGRFRVHLSRLTASSDVSAAGLALQEAQFVVAREYGFENWSDLLRSLRSRSPGQQRYAQVPFDPQWSQLFDLEQDRLRSVFGAAALEIEHIGSTAIEGLAGRGTIDIAVMVASHEEAATFKSTLQGIGYDADPRNWTYTAERDFYTRGDPRDFHLSVAYADRGGFWVRQILFRDYLRAHRDTRDAYAKLKAGLAAADPSGDGYSSGKTEFVYDVLRRAGWKYGQMYVAPGEPATAPAAPITVEGRADLSLAVVFDDGVSGSFDMSGMVGRAAFPQLAAPAEFGRVQIKPGEIRWDAGPVIDPAYLYRLFTRA